MNQPVSLPQPPGSGFGNDAPFFPELNLVEVLDRIPEGFFALDRQWRITYINHRFETMLAVRREQLIGRNMWSCYPSLVGTVYETQFHRALRENVTVQFERFSPRYDGWFEITAYPSETGLSGFFRDISDRKALELELDVQRKNITAAVITAQERERTLIGRELHDGVNQVLTTVKLYQDLIVSGEFEREKLARQSADLLQQSIDEIRCLSKRLSAPTLGNIKLKDSVSELLHKVGSTQKFVVEKDARAIEDLIVSEALHLGVYRILQEQLTNVLKHAGATRVSVCFTLVDELLSVSIRDNGKGFGPHDKRTGIGITNMTSRAESLQGTLTIESAPGKGCTFRAIFPLGTAGQVG